MLTITVQNIPFVIFIVALALLLLVVVYKMFFYKKICTIEYLSLAGIIVLFVLGKTLLPNQYIIWESILAALALGVCGYSIYNLFILEASREAFQNRINQMVKNAPFDSYFCSGKKDEIIDYSESFKKLVNLEDDEIEGTLGFQTLMAKLQPTKVNDNEITSSVAVRLNVDYNAIEGTHNTYNFKLTYVENHETIELLVVIEPIFYKDVFLGRNVYLSKNNRQTLDNVQKRLNMAVEAIQDDRAQLYAMMSMVDNVIMYYDYNTQTYVVTELMAKYLGMVQREFTISEYVQMIHPQDIRHYQDQSSIISSVEVTRMKYRLKLGNVYQPIIEDAMFLNRDAKLISVIHLSGYTKEEEIVDNEDPFQKKEETKKVETSSKPVDYKEKLADTVRILEKILDE